MPVKTSIIIRTLNEGKHLEKVFQGIHGQNYRDWEIVLVDSGSTDRTLELAQEYGARIFHIPTEDFTFGRALNLGCRESHGEYLAFVSGHVWPVTNNWLGNLVEPFQEPSVAMVYGRQRGTDASRLSELHELHRHFGPVSHILVDEPKGNNGNAAIRKELWLSQPFDESLPGLEDVDWARKVQRRGYRVYYAADASVYHVHEETLRQVYRRYLREAIALKRIFPHNRLTWSDIIRGLPSLMVRDVLFAFRQGNRGKVFQVPGNRIAQFVGIRQGMRYQRKLGREVMRGLAIPDTYQRVVVRGPGQHSLCQSEITPIQSNEILVQVAYAGVSSRDPISANGLPRQHASESTKYPFVPGSEYSGIVVQTGSRAGRWKKGQKVAQSCTVRWEQMTISGSVSDSHKLLQCVESVSGAYAQYVAVPSDQVKMLPDDMSLKYGVWVPHVASCLSGLRMLEARRGHSACIIGAGPVANLCAQVLVHKGLRVKAVDPDSRRLALLRKYDMDTGTNISPMEKYDYLIYALVDEDVPAHHLEHGNATTRIVRLLAGDVPPDRTSLPDPAGGEETNSVSRNWLHQDWKEAARLVSNGAINLSDHTSVVRPLEAYQDVWGAADQDRDFKVLLSISEVLKEL